MKTMANTLNILSPHVLGEKLPCKSEEMSNYSCFLSLTRVCMSSWLIFLYSQPPRGQVVCLNHCCVPRAFHSSWRVDAPSISIDNWAQGHTNTHTVANTCLLTLQDGAVYVEGIQEPYTQLNTSVVIFLACRIESESLSHELHRNLGIFSLISS